MEVEHIVKTFTLEQNYLDELAKLAQEGWGVLPMVPPVVVYHLVRIKMPQGVTGTPPMFQGAGQATLTIDETKMGIIRKDADGNEQILPFKVE